MRIHWASACLRAVMLVIALGCPSLARAQQSTTGPVPPPGLDLGPTEFKRAQVVIPGVPPYLWHHGCGPTALGMVVGYWDGNGYPNLVPGSAATQTAAVDAMIADDGGIDPLHLTCDLPDGNHYQDYCCPLDASPTLLPDRSQTGGAHASNCVGDFMRTSWSAALNYYGWSWLDDVPAGFIEYCDLIGNYGPYAEVHSFTQFSWDQYVCEITLERPMVLLVDTDGDGETDHFVTAIGYDDTNQQYGIYNTWDSAIHWLPWRAMGPGTPWGVAFIVVLGYGHWTCCPSADLSTVDPCDDYGGILTCPSRPFPINIFNFTVEARCPWGLPAAGVPVEIQISQPANHFLCDDLILQKVTDANGRATFNLSMGGCTIAPNAVTILANTIPIRTYSSIKSPDWAPTADGDVDLSDFVYFARRYGVGGAGCTDYDGSGVTNLVDFVFFANAWGNRCP
jgi:hypothetical protein